ncbi:MAG: HD domain-containing protein [Clostridia bacterium]|nr:HD domain-containing protein [Clostridia bacterium]
MNFSQPDVRGMVEGFCLIKSVDKKTSSKGDTYLDLTLSDKSGEINAKLWSYNEVLHGTYAANELIKVRGTVSVYAGSDQLRIDKIRHVTESDGVNESDYVPSAEYDVNAMFDELFAIASDFSDQDLKKLVTHLLFTHKTELLYWPAAFKLHHAIRGGLLMHTLSIVRLCESVCHIYPFVDRELLISGAILHDIAKLTEYDVAGTGVASGYSVKGNLIGHLAEGAIMVRKAAEELGIPPESSMLLEHMVLSHHGEPEFGAAVRPMFMEAELLSELDLLDSRVYEMRDALLAAKDNDFTGKLWALDNRKLYNHTRTNLEKNPNLF